MRHGRRCSSVIVRAILQFGIPGLVALLLVGVAAVLVFQDRGEREAVRDARQLTHAIGLGMIQPQLTDGLSTGDPAAVSALDAYVRRHVLPFNHAIVRIKLWNSAERVVYSDEPRLVGKVFPLAEDERGALLGMHTAADISDLSRSENRFDRGNGRLLEVYLPLRTPAGHRLLFEVYLRSSSVSAEARDIWRAFAPPLVGALLLLWLIQLPLAWSFARRLHRGRRERERLLEQAMAASESERRRIAGEVHDGVVQDLAGVSFTLAAAANRARDRASASAMSTAAEQTRQSIRQMRSLVVDIHPANLHSAGLHSALNDLMAPLAARGLQTSATVDDDLAPPPAVEQLVFRTAQEALRNVLAHARAQHVDLEATAHDAGVRLVVRDDGRGFVPAHARRGESDGHLGLARLGDRAADFGGRITIDSAPGRGTRVALEVPAS